MCVSSTVMGLLKVYMYMVVEEHGGSEKRKLQDWEREGPDRSGKRVLVVVLVVVVVLLTAVVEAIMVVMVMVVVVRSLVS